MVLEGRAPTMYAPRRFAAALVLAVASLATLSASASASMRLAAGEDELGEVLDELKKDLRSGDKWERARAVEELAELDRLAAWTLVVDALADRAGEVADAAQLAIGAFDAEEELALIEGRGGLGARDAWVRRRAAEALGRMPAPVDVAALARRLTDDDARVRRMLLWSIERRARAGRSPGPPPEGVVSRLARCAAGDRDVGNRARALFALAAVVPERARSAVAEAAAARHPALRCAAAAMAGGSLGEGAASTLGELAGDPERAVRGQALAALTRLATKDALAVLVERLAVETEERLLVQLVERLQRLSGLKHRRDPRPWRDWLATLPADWRAPPPVAGPSGTAPAGEATDDRSVAFAGMTLLSKRLAILIDLSGSMWTEREDGRTRKELVEDELAEVLERLDPSTRFNLIPFTERPRPWQDELTPATKKNVRDALRFFARCSDRGTGNFWDAAQLALEDPDVDTLLVLTDGMPTGGRRHRLELIVPLYLEADVTRCVAVDSILIDASPWRAEWWATLAKETGGRSIPVAW